MFKKHRHNANQIKIASNLTADERKWLRDHGHTSDQVYGSISGTTEVQARKQAMGRQHWHDVSQVS